MRSHGTWMDLVAYGLPGLPLAFAALPLYVQWPAYAALSWGLPLAGLGALLLAVRVGDAFVDPWVGRWIDSRHAHAPRRVWHLMGLAGLLLAAGFVALLHAPLAVQADATLMWAWAGAALVSTSVGYSVGQIAHQSWAVRLGGTSPAQARWAGAREGFALAGVLLASVLPTWAGWDLMPGLLAAMLIAGWSGLWWVMPKSHPCARVVGSSVEPSLWRQRAFRRLMAINLLNGLASAWPATLVLWFMRDRLQAPPWAEGSLLALYFGAAALSVPLWVWWVDRLGGPRAWASGMALAVISFAGVAVLGTGQWAAFAWICVGTGFALGADLVVPPVLLARWGGPARAGRWFGWWTAAGKLNLALAAGLALPLLHWSGFVPGQRDAMSLEVLVGFYAAVPFALKLLAMALLISWRHALDPHAGHPHPQGELPSSGPCHI